MQCYTELLDRILKLNQFRLPSRLQVYLKLLKEVVQKKELTCN